jgi:hypothetical protein
MLQKTERKKTAIRNQYFIKTVDVRFSSQKGNLFLFWAFIHGKLRKALADSPTSF